MTRLRSASARMILAAVQARREVTPDMIVDDILCLLELAGYRDGLAARGMLGGPALAAINRRDAELRGRK